MKCLLALCFLLTVYGQQPVATYTRFCATCGIRDAESILSQSGQFVVHGPTGRYFAPRTTPDSPRLIELEPQLVAVTAERTKRAFLEDLVVQDTFRDKIHLVLLPRGTPDQPITVVSHMHTDGFQYQVGLPVYLQTNRLIKAVAQVLLQEYSNRGVRRNAELPTWLVEGMTRQLLATVVPPPLVNRTPQTVQPRGFDQLELVRQTFERRGFDRLEFVRPYFQTNDPLTIQELSFSNLPGMTPEERFRYESSAHLFVHELLRLRGGPGLLSTFIQSLPRALNWQTAFHAVYQNYFRTPLDLEKWWMLSCLEVKKREARQTWSTSVSLERLDSILKVSLEYRVSTNAIPERREASLQEVLNLTDFGVQRELLGQKLQQIYLLSVNLSDDAEPLAYAYEQAIESYLQKRALGEYQPALKSDPEQRLQLLTKSAIATFDQLDRAREDVAAGRPPQLPQTPKKPGRQIIISRENSRN